MAGILDGGFGGGGTGILPDWLFNSNGLADVGPDMTAYGTPGMPTVPMPTLPPDVPSPGMTADMPFADRWNPIMQAMASGASGGGGAGILPDRLWQNPQPIAEMPNAMDGGTPAGSFEDRWSGVAALPPMQSIGDLFRGGANPDTSVPLPRPRPDIAPGGEGPPQPVAPPAGNPVAGGGDFMSRVGDWINNNRNALALFGAGIAGGGGTGSWNAGMSDALRGLVTGGRVDSAQRQQQAAQQYISNATDIDPQRKAAMLANPALAAQYLSARAKRPYVTAGIAREDGRERPYAGAPGIARQRPVGYDWADVRDTSKGLQATPRANAPEPGGSIIGKPGETIIGYGEWQPLPNGARIR